MGIRREVQGGRTLTFRLSRPTVPRRRPAEDRAGSRCSPSRELILDDENSRFEEFEEFDKFELLERRAEQIPCRLRRREGFGGKSSTPYRGPEDIPPASTREGARDGRRSVQAGINRRGYEGHSKTPTSSALARQPRRRLLAARFRDCSPPRLACSERTPSVPRCQYPFFGAISDSRISEPTMWSRTGV